MRRDVVSSRRVNPCMGNARRIENKDVPLASIRSPARGLGLFKRVVKNERLAVARKTFIGNGLKRFLERTIE